MRLCHHLITEMYYILLTLQTKPIPNSNSYILVYYIHLLEFGIEWWDSLFHLQRLKPKVLNFIPIWGHVFLPICSHSFTYGWRKPVSSNPLRPRSESIKMKAKEVSTDMLWRSSVLSLPGACSHVILLKTSLFNLNHWASVICK